MSRWATFEKVTPDRSAGRGGDQLTAVWGLLGLITGFAIGCASAQVSLQGGDFEHGAPGIGVYILFVMAFRAVFGAVVGLFVGLAIASRRTARAKPGPSEDDHSAPATSGPSDDEGPAPTPDS